MRSRLRLRRDALLRAADPDPGLAALLADAPLDPGLEEVLPDGTSRWPISPRLGRFLARAVVARGLRNVLELGAGASSLVLARAMASAGGGRLTSVEQAPEWCAGPWAGVQATPRVEARMIVARPRLGVCRMGPVYLFADAARAVAARGPYDLVLVDAPQWYYGRDGALPLVHDHLAPGAWVVLDDAGRPGERWTLFRWLRTYPGLRLACFDPEFGGRGIAVLRFTGVRARRVDPWSVLTGGLHAARLARIRHAAGR